MSIEEVEVAVVGAGPSGLITARESALRGAKVLVLEEHKEIGLPNHCAGLLSINGLGRIGIPLNESYVQNKVKGARFFSPSNLSFTIERKEAVACVVDRHLLDNFLAKQALKNGALIKLNSKVKSVKRCNNRWVLEAENYGKVKTKILIDAEGASPRILGMTGLKTLGVKRLLRGFQADLEGVNVDPDYVEVHFSREIAPGFFAWVIPLNKDVARVGLACKYFNPRERLFRFIKKRFKKAVNEKLKILRFYSGLIITCGPIEKTYDDNLLVVGDSAGQVKPITGGGVIFGGTCAIIAGKIASEAIKSGKTEREFLKRYEDERKARIGKEIKISLLIRRILNKISDKSIDRVFSVIIEEEIHRDISEGGDMDLQGSSIIKIFRRRGDMKSLFMILKAILFH
ncbi:MAG: NAD(P)/FAD-dependent oxidoreductase [Candidatus Bathyarchaeia archaeon]